MHRFLYVAVILYAFLGSPTPDTPGITEALIGACLVLSVGVTGAARSFMISMRAPIWRTAGQVFLIYGLSIPFLTGVLTGQSPSLMIRDVLPFLFMMLPVFLGPAFEDRPARIRALRLSLIMLGFVFAVRAIGDQADLIAAFLRFAPPAEELTYFANAPTVLFTGLFLIGTAGRYALTGHTVRDACLYPPLLLAAALIVFMPLVMTAQRASLGYAALYGGTLLLCGFWYSPKRTGILAAMLVAGMLLFMAPLHDILMSLLEKTDLVGANRRFEEWAAVWDAITQNPGGAFVGLGWGGTFESPAVGGVRVNFSHGLLSSLLLKTGITGLCLGAIYLAGLMWAARFAFIRDPVVMMALAGPVLIDVVLYASFKSLDFGLIVLLVTTYAQVYKTSR